MSRIFHIATSADWDAAQLRGTYETASLTSEGFIHCSTAEQVIPTANALFLGQPNLRLLEIEVGRLASKIRYEPPASAAHEGDEQLFPHIYGSLNLDAVFAVTSLEPASDGLFTWRPPEAGSR